MMNWDDTRFAADVPLEKAVIVDQDATTSYIITAVSGIPCVRFSCHEKLLSALPRLRPAVVFMDGSFNYFQSGINILAELRAAWPFVPIIAIVDQLSGDRVTQANAQVVDDFICKPLQARELRVRIHLGVRNRAYLAMALARQYFRAQPSLLSAEELVLLQDLMTDDLGTSNDPLSLPPQAPALDTSKGGLGQHRELLQGALRAIGREKRLELLYKESSERV